MKGASVVTINHETDRTSAGPYKRAEPVAVVAPQSFAEIFFCCFNEIIAYFNHDL